ncbi:MAG: cell division protein ZapA [Pseudomonadota bacterium]
MSNVQTVTVSILDKSYQVNCKVDEVAALRQSASYLDEKMREIKAASGVVGLDRIAVMAALNIANDFLAEARKNEGVIKAQDSEISSLNMKLDTALDRLRASNRQSNA